MESAKHRLCLFHCSNAQLLEGRQKGDSLNSPSPSPVRPYKFAVTTRKPRLAKRQVKAWRCERAAHQSRCRAAFDDCERIRTIRDIRTSTRNDDDLQDAGRGR